jgi:hypothetical protein
MMYHSRWLFDDEDGVTCDTTPTSDIEMTILTDFVGDDTNTTAALYMAPTTVTQVDDIANYPASDFCTSFPDFCFQGYGFGDDNLLSSYENDFCVEANEATWGAACTSDSQLISTPTYSDVSKLLRPQNCRSCRQTPCRLTCSLKLNPRKRGAFRIECSAFFIRCVALYSLESKLPPSPLPDRSCHLKAPLPPNSMGLDCPFR